MAGSTSDSTAEPDTKQTKETKKLCPAPRNALVNEDDPDLLTAIRSHPKLEGYLDRGGPPGYLVIKSDADPENFIYSPLPNMVLKSKGFERWNVLGTTWTPW